MAEVGGGQILEQLLIGSLLVAGTVAIHAQMLNFLTNRITQMEMFAARHFGSFANTAVIIKTILFIMLAHTLEVWLWAMALMLIDALDGFEPSLYFSLVSFTTLGYGDITLSDEWRLLAGLIGANGFLLFGWSTAYMVEVIRRTF